MVGSPALTASKGTTWRSTEIILGWTVYGSLCQVREERGGTHNAKNTVYMGHSHCFQHTTKPHSPPFPLLLSQSFFHPPAHPPSPFRSRVPFARDLSGAFVGVQGLVQGQRSDSRKGETGSGACGRGQDRGAGRRGRHGPTLVDSMKIELSSHMFGVLPPTVFCSL